jgi:hypothetical protein
LHKLHERRLIKPDLHGKYTLDGQFNTITGEMDLQLYSHCHLLVECTDFNFKEMAASQYLGTKFGVTVNLTTKFYAELAREGIIYSWAHAKAFYQ